MKSSPQKNKSKNLVEQDIIQSIQHNLHELNKPVTKTSVNETSAVHKKSSKNESSSFLKQNPQQVHTYLSLNAENDQHSAIFQANFLFEGGVPFFAVFSQDTEWYLALSFPSTFHFKKDDVLTLDQNVRKKIHFIKEFQHKDGLLIKISLTEKLYPHVVYINEKNTLSLRFGSHPPQEEQKQEFLYPKKRGDPFQIRIPHGRVFGHFFDQDTQMDFWVVTAEPTLKSSYVHHRFFPEFEILESCEGLAIYPYHHDLNITFDKKKIELNNPSGNSVRLENRNGGDKKERISPLSLFQDFDPKQAPKRIVELTQLSFKKDRPLSESIESVWLYIGLGKISEAVSIMNRLKEVSSDLLLVPAFKALEGISQLLMGRGNKANKILSSLEQDRSIAIWGLVGKIANTNKLISKDNSDFHHLIQHKDELFLLPDPLYKNILSQILQAGLLHNDLNSLKTFSSPSFKPKNIDISDKMDSLGYYKLASCVVALLESKKNTHLLEEMATFYMNPQISALAKFELLQILRKEHKISPEKELKELDSLRFQWRGGLLEYKINLYLAQRYIEERKYQKALPLLRKTSEYFPDLARQDKVPLKMQEALRSYFSQSPFPPLLQALSIFQEFGDIVPDSKEGDFVMMQGTHQLVKLKLHKDVRSLLLKHLNKKCKIGKSQDLCDRRNKILYCLAYTYYLDEQFEEMFKTFKEIQSPSPKVLTSMNLMKSEAYEKQGDIDQAIHALGTSEEELFRAGDLHFVSKEWEKAISVYEKLIKLHKDKGVKDKSGFNQQNRKIEAVFHLMLCHALADNKEHLPQLHKEYGPLFKKTKYESIFNFLTLELMPQDKKKPIDLKSLKTYLESVKKIFPPRSSQIRYLL